jgi:GNAT superfamily N-acetyltransferase
MAAENGPAARGARGDVVRANVADLDVLGRVIADAFHSLPPSCWLIADQAARKRIFPGYFRLYVEHALASGVVHTTADRTAAALWFPIGRDAEGQPSDYGARLAGATAPWTERFLAFDATLDRHHPAGVAHHHLAILAVRPDRQGQGIGTALLGTYHQILDSQDGPPAYLEAGDLRTLGLYERHGYVLLPHAPFYLPDSGPPMWPMWRDCHGQNPRGVTTPESLGS